MILDQRVPAVFAENTEIQQILRHEKPTGFQIFDEAERSLLVLLSRGMRTVDAAKEPSVAHLGERHIKTLRSRFPRLVGAQTLDQTIYLGLHHGFIPFEDRDLEYLAEPAPAQYTALGLAALGFNRPAAANFQYISRQGVANNQVGLYDRWAVHDMPNAIVRAFEIGYWTVQPQVVNDNKS